MGHHRYRVTRTMSTVLVFAQEECDETGETPEQWARTTAEEMLGDPDEWDTDDLDVEPA